MWPQNRRARNFKNHWSDQHQKKVVDNTLKRILFEQMSDQQGRRYRISDNRARQYQNTLCGGKKETLEAETPK